MTEWNNKELGGKVRNATRSISPVTGITTNSSVNVIDLDTRQFRDTELIIANTGGNSLYYSIRVRNEYDLGADFTVFSNEISVNDEDESILVRHSRIFVDVQSYVSDNHTTFSITAIGGT